jgi:hypothetical protein
MCWEYSADLVIQAWAQTWPVAVIGGPVLRNKSYISRQDDWLASAPRKMVMSDTVTEIHLA